MGPVAVRRFTRALAVAQGNVLLLIDGELDRRELGAGVGTIAKRLALRLAASAPPIGFPGLELEYRGFLLRNDGIAHVFPPQTSALTF
jgi:hypothetical protein